ncbi:MULTISPECIES: patatin-like phospholipase family protein [Paracoccus]|uniref:Patatin-like phospholipase family protein n=1 Tax=Paracoccus litorisediminis TaxID=2006130 RepID=A0A844HXS4_9RHOB|nr:MULTISPECIES: patatin-like phospholipase family protein [Paracoccus]MBD9529459.1 patatin-like phospholipase family protein [Paracoccus sp. PAR01]MTH62291.1 patatin-like phospholipase family protein [Paracoccus litorisediminis]
MEPKRINLALQGGGAHGAFAWGVIERLLQEERIEIAGISGTSAGALNGAALAAGLACGPGKIGRDAARENLDYIWSQIAQVSDNRVVRWMHSLFPVPRALQRLTEMISPFAWLEGFTRIFSPYDCGPFYSNPLAAILREMPHPDLTRGRGPRLFVSATNVRTGRIRVFGGAEVTVDAILASACLPTLFRAVEIPDPATGRREAYWDGGFSGNPALFPLFAPDLPRDVVIVTINPMLRDMVPHSPMEIQDRINEISFNASLLRELRAINFVKRLHDEDRLTGRPMKNVLIHMVMDDFMMGSLSATTKVVPKPGMVAELREAGRAAAERFLQYHGQNLGQRDSVNLPALFA